MKHLLTFLAFLTISTFTFSQNSTSKQYDGLKAIIVPQSNHVEEGGTYKARIYFNRLISGELSLKIDGISPELIKWTVDGEEIALEIKCPKIGFQPVNGEVLIKNGGTVIKNVSFSTNIVVTKPSSIIINSKTSTLLYNNIENEITASVSGYRPDQLKLVVNNGKITKKGFKFYVKPDKLGDCKITVYVEKEGNFKKVNEETFKVIEK